MELDNFHQDVRHLLIEICSEQGIAHGTSSEDGRLLAIVNDGDGTRIEIASDGLSLDHKIAVERALIRRLPEIASELTGCQIRFRRVVSGHPSASAPGPRPKIGVNRTTPFGLSRKNRPIIGVDRVIVVASGKGGVGKSTVSTNLAVSLANLYGKRVGLLDADVYGPSAPTMLGTIGSVAVNGEGKLEPITAHGVKCMSFGFMSDALNPVMWRGPMVGKAVHQFCYDVDWGSLDYLVVDLPPGTGDVQLSLIETLPIDRAIIVSTPQDVALIDAHKAVSMFEKLGIPVTGLVENMCFHVCQNCGHEDAVFGHGGAAEFARDRGLPILARFPIKGEIRERSDLGMPIALDDSSPQGLEFGKLALALM